MFRKSQDSSSDSSDTSSDSNSESDSDAASLFDKIDSSQLATQPWLPFSSPRRRDVNLRLALFDARRFLLCRHWVKLASALEALLAAVAHFSNVYQLGAQGVILCELQARKSIA